MVRDVRFITLNSSYRELQEMLLTGQLKTLALVESRGELGSLEVGECKCVCASVEGLEKR